MRVIAVVMGEPDSTTRNNEVKEMLDYAYSQYKLQTLISRKKQVKTKEVIMGKKEKVGIVATDSITILNKKIDGNKDVTYNVKVNDIKAPVKVGDIVGKMEILDNGKVIRTINLTVNENILKASIFELYGKYLKEILVGE